MITIQKFIILIAISAPAIAHTNSPADWPANSAQYLSHNQYLRTVGVTSKKI